MSTAYFDKIRIYPKYPSEVVIQWKLSDAYLNGDYKFTITRSVVPNADFINITTVPLVNTYSFTDQLVQGTEVAGLTSLFRSMYYQITVLQPDGTELASDVLSIGHLIDRRAFLKAKEIQRKFNLLCNSYIGTPVAILKRRNYGPICSLCYDPIKKESRDSKCPECFGTGRSKGYYPAIYGVGHLQANVNRRQLTLERGLVEDNSTSFRMVANPIIEPYDIIVETETNNRWHVSSESNITELRRIPVSQVVAVKEMSRTHVAYTIPLEEKGQV